MESHNFQLFSLVAQKRRLASEPPSPICPSVIGWVGEIHIRELPGSLYGHKIQICDRIVDVQRTGLVPELLGRDAYQIAADLNAVE